MGNHHRGPWVGALYLSLLAACGQILPGDQADEPSASDLSITPTPRKGQTLVCHYTFADPEGDPDLLTVRWLVNDQEVATGSTLDDGFVGGDTVTCEVTPADGTKTGEPASVTAPVLHAAITGSVFLDGDQDGERDDGEQGIVGHTVFLDDDRDGALDDGEASTSSDESGLYEFPDLMPGSYRVAQVAGAWSQTYPTIGAVYADDFGGTAVDVGHWTLSGNGVSQAGGVLTVDRDDAADSAVFRPSLGDAGRVLLTIRNTRMNWKDMFHGFQITGTCDQERDVAGLSFGFSRYGNFYLGQLRCNGASYAYPTAYTIDQWYEIEAIYGDGEIMIRVDGVERATGQVPKRDLALSLPGIYTDGGAETNSISEVDQVSVEVRDETHRVDVEDGDIAGGLDFGTSG